MCGIAGLLDLRGDAIDRALLRRVTGALSHRGPEATAVWVRGEGGTGGRGDGGTGRSDKVKTRPAFDLAGPPVPPSPRPPLAPVVGLGHTRLRIIDIEGGDQPIWNEDASCLIVFNGEIYNFRELRHDLEARGHRFATATDTEAILHAYEEWGEACPERLRGMFALAIWDERRRQLFLARDRLGIKPLHLAWRGTTLAFASEIKALLQDADLDRGTDPDALESYLALGYVPGPGTMLRTVTSLPAGHSLTVRLGEPIPVPRRFWRLPVGVARPRSEDTCLQELDDLLTDVIRRHMISDVPLGVFLSGGVDSSILAAVASGVSTAPVRTFSIGFPDSGYDEAPMARQVARRFGTEHTECLLSPDAMDLLPRLSGQLDQPLADPSAIPLFYLCEMTREHVTVALAGDGGDELFGGYERYFWDGAAARYAGLPRLLRQGLIEPAVRRLPRLPLDVRRDPFRRAQKFVRYASLPAARRYFHWFELLKPEFRRELSAESSTHEAEGCRIDTPARVFEQAFAEAAAMGASPLDAMQYCDIQTMLRDDLLHKCDRVSMAVSLEARVPFLDHVMVEWAFTLPEEMRVRGRTLKYLLKRWLAQRLPAEWVYRRKQGFEVPLYDWLTESAQCKRGRRGTVGRECVHDLLLAPTALSDGPFLQAGVRRLVARLEDGDRVLALPVYSLLVWDLWRRQLRESAVAGAGT